MWIVAPGTAAIPLDAILSYDREIQVLIEPKPNEPIDRSFCPTLGHVMGLSAQTADPTRVGGLLESAHAIAGAARLAPTLKPEQTIVVNLSGRGDKDVAHVARLEQG